MHIVGKFDATHWLSKRTNISCFHVQRWTTTKMEISPKNVQCVICAIFNQFPINLSLATSPVTQRQYKTTHYQTHAVPEYTNDPICISCTGELYWAVTAPFNVVWHTPTSKKKLQNRNTYTYCIRERREYFVLARSLALSHSIWVCVSEQE